MKINNMEKQSIRMALTNKLNELGKKHNGGKIEEVLPTLLFEMFDFTGALMDAEFELRKMDNLSFAPGTNVVTPEGENKLDGISQKQVLEILFYCKNHIDQFWAAKIVGMIFSCDFKEARERLKRVL